MNFKHPTSWRFIALGGYFGTLAFLMLWIIWLAPPTSPKSIVLTIALLPMLPAIRGILHGRNYTHQWASFLALPYFAFGVDAIVHRADKNWLGWILVALTIMWFFGCVYYAKFDKLTNQTQSNV